MYSVSKFIGSFLFAASNMSGQWIRMYRFVSFSSMSKYILWSFLYDSR